MILRRFYDEALAQASYLVGCQVTREAIVVDPLREVSPYLEIAKAEGLEITHVTETHIHADFLSGTRELVAQTGARMYLSGEGGPDWTYRFGPDDLVLLGDGDRIRVGNIQIDVMHTPGHTPEHLTFLVTDTAGADRPMGAFTGDFVFVGDVGRPDLLEKAAGVEGTMKEAAGELFRSLQRFKLLDDWLQIWPGHGAGSACGKSLGAVPTSTLGYERRFNWGFSYADEGSFIEAVLTGQPEPPAYFAQMKRLNRDGPPLLSGVADPRVLGSGWPGSLPAEDALVVDVRGKHEFAAGHLPGALSLPFNRQFLGHAGWLLPYDRDMVLVGENAAQTDPAGRSLRLIGLDRVVGLGHLDVLDANGDMRWMQTGRAISTADLADSLEAGELTLLDVRWAREWNSGHLPRAVHLPLGDLPSRVASIDRSRPVAVYCATGGRSGIAASILQAAGVLDVRDVTGGSDRWIAEGRPLERPPSPLAFTTREAKVEPRPASSSGVHHKP